MKDPRKLLLTDKLASDGKPLFASLAEMARQISKIDGGGFEDKSPEDIRVYLTQVMRPGVGPGRRKPSPNLKRALLALIKQRVTDNNEAIRISDELNSALEQTKTLQINRPLEAKEVWGTLVEMAEKAKKTLIFTKTPAEFRPDDPHASELTGILINRLFLYEGDDNICTYEFYLKDIRDAERLRSNLAADLAKKRFDGDVTKAWTCLLELEDAKRFSVYVIPQDLFLPPMCVMDPDTNGWSAFNLYYHNSNNVSVAKIDEESFRDWDRLIYSKLRDNSIKAFNVAKRDCPF